MTSSTLAEFQLDDLRSDHVEDAQEMERRRSDHVENNQENEGEVIIGEPVARIAQVIRKVSLALDELSKTVADTDVESAGTGAGAIIYSMAGDSDEESDRDAGANDDYEFDESKLVEMMKRLAEANKHTKSSDDPVASDDPRAKLKDAIRRARSILDYLTAKLKDDIRQFPNEMQITSLAAAGEVLREIASLAANHSEQLLVEGRTWQQFENALADVSVVTLELIGASDIIESSISLAGNGLDKVRSELEGLGNLSSKLKEKGMVPTLLSSTFEAMLARATDKLNDVQTKHASAKRQLSKGS